MDLRFSGAYQVRVLRPDGSVRLETDFFDNLITNSGLDWLGGIYSPAAFVTTGTTPPVAGDTGVSGTILGYVSSYATSSDFVQVTTLPNYGQKTYYYTFAVGGVIGAISELAIGTGSLSGVTRLFSRALIVNSGGTPITITLTATDQLQIVYIFRQYAPDGDTTFDMDVNGVTRTFTVRPAFLSSASGFWTPSLLGRVGLSGYTSQLDARTGAIGLRSASPAGSSYSASSAGSNTYVAGTYRRSFYMVWLPAVGTFTAASFFIAGASGCAGTWQLGVSPSIVKTNLQTLRIEGEYSWGRYVP